MIKTVEMDFTLQPPIPRPPARDEQLYSAACAGDKVTIVSWRDIWLKQIRKNHELFGPFRDKSIGQFFGQWDKQPAIVVGSGPSLKENVTHLQDTAGIPVVSCLHNFHYLEDHDVKPRFYVTLDAGPVTIEEVYEGGKRTAAEYWDLTKDRTLIAFIGSNPDLLERWKGDIYFYNAPIGETGFMDEVDKVEKFHTYISNGGNVLGACTYFSKAISGANPIAFVGADFCFSYTNKFHAWESKYDKSLGNTIAAVDIWGNKVLTWQSYYNFKYWFDWLACRVPGLWVNCTEGGCLGAYPGGNISQIKQMALSDFVKMYTGYWGLEKQCADPETDERLLLF